MDSRGNGKTSRPNVGLCDTCAHTRVIRSDRGSVFYQCAFSFVDPAYPKYPRLPVLTCAGYQQSGSSNTQ